MSDYDTTPSEESQDLYDYSMSDTFVSETGSHYRTGFRRPSASANLEEDLEKLSSKVDGIEETLMNFARRIQALESRKPPAPPDPDKTDDVPRGGGLYVDPR